MEGMEAVVESVDTGSEVEEQIEETQEGQQQEESGQEEQQETADDPYSPKSSREFSQALKAWRDSSPENAKFARIAKDDHARLYQLHQMEPRGIDGIREKYAMLDSVMHGELKGADAIGAIQDQLREASEVDELLADGNPQALEALGPEFDAGLAKLAPSILDRIRSSDPEAYSAAVLPHFIEALKSSDLVGSYNGMVDVLNEQMPNWLPDDKKQAWAADKMQRVMALAGNMGAWLNAQAEKAGKLPKAGDVPRGTNGKADPISEREKAFHKEQQDHHWNTNISPKLDQHANQSFQKLFQPYASRLRLDAPAASALKMEFSKRVAQKAAANPAYMSQVGRYRASKNPDPGTVLNFAKVEFDKYAKSVMDGLVNERYKPFLNGKAQNTAAKNTTDTQRMQQRRGPISPGVKIVTVKPPMEQRDMKNTPLDWIHQQKYRMKDGSIVQVRN